MHARRPFQILSVIFILGFLLMLPGAAETARGEAARSPMPLRTGSLVQGGSLYWNSFLGGGRGYFVTVDANGEIYVAGSSDATWGNPVRPFAGGYMDGFVAKLDRNGALLWNTFLGGTSSDEARGIAVDGSGNVHVTGHSYVGWGSPISPFAGDGDAFVATLDANGSLIWNTFLGSAGIDQSSGIALDADANAYVVGYSHGSWGKPLHPFAGDTDAFVAKVDSTGALAWNTFLGSADTDLGFSIAIDRAGNICITGVSGDTWGSPVNPFADFYDAFVAKLDGSGALVWNTFVGSLGAVDGIQHAGYDIALDADANAYIVGDSAITWGAPVNPFAGGGSDAFIAKVDGTGALAWNTFLGSAGYDEAYGIALDADANAYIVGDSANTWGAPVRPFVGDGHTDAFVAKVDSAGVRAWNTFLGGAGIDYGISIAVDGHANAYTVGGSASTWGNPLRAHSSGSDAFVAKLGNAGTFPSIGLQDGSLLESAETSGKGGTLNATAATFNLGDDAADRQYRAILSFNTATLPDDAVITKATLKIKRQAIVGTNPFNTHIGLTVDVRKPYFGPMAALGITDFQALASKTAVATFNKIPTSGAWYSAVLRSGAYPYIAKTGLTQFRLRFAKDDNDDRNADYLKFYSGDAILAYRPLLVLEYYIP